MAGRTVEPSCNPSAKGKAMEEEASRRARSLQRQDAAEAAGRKDRKEERKLPSP